MARILNRALLFEGTTLTGVGSSITSAVLDVSRNEYASMHYELNRATTSLLIAGTIRLLVSADSLATFVRPTNPTGGDVSTLYQFNSNNQAFTVDIPAINYAQIQFISSTAGNIIFNNVWLMWDELD